MQLCGWLDHDFECIDEIFVKQYDSLTVFGLINNPSSHQIFVS